MPGGGLSFVKGNLARPISPTLLTVFEKVISKELYRLCAFLPRAKVFLVGPQGSSPGVYSPISVDAFTGFFPTDHFHDED